MMAKRQARRQTSAQFVDALREVLGLPGLYNTGSRSNSRYRAVMSGMPTHPERVHDGMRSRRGSGQ
jgi:hypothetical protein